MNEIKCFHSGYFKTDVENQQNFFIISAKKVCQVLISKNVWYRIFITRKNPKFSKKIKRAPSKKMLLHNFFLWIKEEEKLTDLSFLIFTWL
jgi:hypothetical protein